MKSIFEIVPKNTKFYIIILIICAISISSFYIFSSSAQAISEDTCNELTIPLGDAGFKASCNISVEEKSVYSIFFEYFYTSDDEAINQSMRESLGTPVYKGEPGKKYWTEQTHPVTVHVQVVNSKTGEIYANEIIRPEASIKGKYSIMSEVLKGSLEPGDYKIEFDIVNTDQKLKSVDTKLKFSKSYTGN